MGQYNIRIYHPDLKGPWNKFVENSKNGTFLFHRDFMDYHGDRFQDFSLLVYKGTKLIALLPANSLDNSIHSHQGLSYGGFVLSADIKFKPVKEMFADVLKYLSFKGIEVLNIKEIPSIYHSHPSDEINYLMNIVKAKLTRKDSLSTIDLRSPFKIAANRDEGRKKALQHELKIEEVDDFKEFWNTVLVENLKRKHNTQPVHSLKEIEYLKSRFPNNIRQFNVYKENKIVAGTTIFESKNVAHSQYISGLPETNPWGSLDFLYSHLITKVFKHKNFFDFGNSNENNGSNINEGLLFWKEGFGARTLSQNFYKIKTENFHLLDALFI